MKCSRSWSPSPTLSEATERTRQEGSVGQTCVSLCWTSLLGVWEYAGASLISHLRGDGKQLKLNHVFKFHTSEYLQYFKLLILLQARIKNAISHLKKLHNHDHGVRFAMLV